jgi:hypothetical protein
MFADDTNIFYAGSTFSEVEKVVNEELTHVMKYCKINKLSVNFKKTNYLIITSPQKRSNVSVKINNIEQKEFIKYLGIYVDENIKWSFHI